MEIFQKEYKERQSGVLLNAWREAMLSQFEIALRDILEMTKDEKIRKRCKEALSEFLSR